MVLPVLCGSGVGRPVPPVKAPDFTRGRLTQLLETM